MFGRRKGLSFFGGFLVGIFGMFGLLNPGSIGPLPEFGEYIGFTVSPYGKFGLAAPQPGVLPERISLKILPVLLSAMLVPIRMSVATALQRLHLG